MREHRRATSPQAIALAGGILVAVLFIAVAITGCFGGSEDPGAATESTASATTQTETGVVDQPTEQLTQTVGLVPTGDPIRLNDQGPRVERLQTALTELGFSPGPSDGVFGPKTERAVKAFQRSVDLEPSGIVTSQTANALNNALTGLAG